MNEVFLAHPEGDLLAIYLLAIEEYITNPDEELRSFILDLWEKIK